MGRCIVSQNNTSQCYFITISQIGVFMGVLERVIGRRKEFEITQGDIASALGVGRSAIAQWERGGDSIPVRYHKALAEVLHCSLRWLETGDGEPGDIDPPEGYLDHYERRLLDLFRIVPDDAKKLILNNTRRQKKKPRRLIRNNYLQFFGDQIQPHVLFLRPSESPPRLLRLGGQSLPILPQ